MNHQTKFGWSIEPKSLEPKASELKAFKDKKALSFNFLLADKSYREKAGNTRRKRLLKLGYPVY